MVVKYLNYSFWFRSILALIFLIGSISVFAQQRISGTIIDETGEGLPGVTIKEVGTSNGTITDIDGSYSLTVPQGAKISISFVGYVTQEITVGTQSVIDVTMDPDVTALDEVVVIGYGTQKRSDLTGAIVSVTGDALKKVPVSSVAESLSGRLAGVQVSATEGSPDAQINIRVRGGGSITQDNSPLIIVDGFPINSLSDISPSDIKSIDVLKDASSTAIFGSRGANGVIIVTTKTGTTNGKLQVSYNTFYGQRKIANPQEVLSAEDYAKWQYEYAMLDNPNDLTSYEDYFGTFNDLDLYQGTQSNDWQSIIYGRVGQVFSNDINISGGTDKTNFSANYARYDDKAIMIGSSFIRNNLTFKLNNKPNDRVDLGFSLRYSNTDIYGGGANEQNEVSSADSRLKHSLGYSPIPIPGLTTGVDDTNEQTAGNLVNPIAATLDNNRIQSRRNYNVGGFITWRITDVLQVRSDMGADFYDRVDNRFYGLTTYFVQNRPAADFQNQPAVVMRNSKDVRIRNTNTLSYDFKELVPNDHSIKVLVGNEILTRQYQELTSEIHGFPAQFNSTQAFSLTTQGGYLFSVDNNLSPDDKLLSYFSRVNYEFKGRYLLSATYRADGSSKFLGDNRWGYFPSAAAAWKVSEESFMEGTSSWLNSLKLRASYGKSGNNNIPVGQTLQTFNSSQTTWINGFSNYWAPSRTLANPDLKWETTTTRNLGLDFGLFNGKILGSLDVYQNNTTDLLLRFPGVSSTGYTDQFQNLGETQNKGLEVAVQYYAIDTDKYGLNFNFNMSFNKNKIVSLGTLEDFGWSSGWASTQIGSDYLIASGQSLGRMLGYVSDGRYEVSDFDYDSGTGDYALKAGVADASDIVGDVMPGMMKLKDLNDDGIVDLEDQKIIGNANPKFAGGFVINGYAYGFDMSAAFSYSYGNSIYNANKVEFTTANQNSQYRNLLTIQESGKRWTNINPENGAIVTDPDELASLNANTTMWSPFMERYVFSDWAVEDGSFLRLNTFTVGYTIPASMVSKYRINSLRVYTTAYNVFVLTKYSGYDPEVSTRRQTPLTPGVDYSAYPRSRMVVVGLNLTF